ncbi:LysM peptidoglycan-binding domain-containing protein [Flavobacterium sp. 5]|uniref:C40 family peptidase n=1 Tax=Flavobacterium sp. 5 TaxID=2035199 RepID=UPI000C2CAE03|nr:LysM peptidoglycan-binding domain-containing protein [Flavobacterium sp. 5]PKB15773.1 LysM domain-containing protein [Flavobacterium sp. 5]
MSYFRVIVLALFFCSISVFSQENNIKHTIVKGETISSIAQKYNVSIASIYKLNPKAKKTLHLNQVLVIPNSESKKENSTESLVSEQTTEVTHEVLAKETLYGITKQFKTTKELLYKANPKLETEGLKIGQTIIVPSSLSQKEIVSLSNTKVEEVAEMPAPLTHQVKAKESLYVIAKEYGITLKELQNANPNIGKKGLSIGQVISIPSNGKLKENEAVVDNESLKEKEVPVAEIKATVPVVDINTSKEIKTDSESQTAEIIHVVLTKETKYGIAKKYGITVADLEKQNPSIQQKLDVGAKLTIQVPNTTVEKVIVKEEMTTVSQVEKPQDSISVRLPIANQDLIEKLIQEASDKIGTRYRSGGTTTAGFDCSGLMCSTFGAFDIKLPRSSIEQSSFGEKIDDENVQKGDLIFFRTNGRSHINHVGMVIEVGEGEIKFIHSSTHSGVIVSSTKEPYYHKNFAQVNRVLK